MYLLVFNIFLGTTILLHCGVILQTSADDAVIVDITQGTLQGRSVTTEAGVTFYSFSGIPYAKPPVGNLRFKAPEPPEAWEGIRDATKEGSECPQPNILQPTFITGDEDCLYLNVYTSELPSDDDISLKLPVMVVIHGGAFYIGSGSITLFGPDWLIDNGGIVLVAINYRLGALGFLGLDHSDVSKNNGLKDQVAALKWVHNNIDKFGGNPDDVTIIGGSAGAASVNYHLLSPQSEGLFHKAIAQSGSTLNIWAYIDPETAHQRAVALAGELNLNTNDTSEILDSLREVTAEDIVRAQIAIPGPLYLQLIGGNGILFTLTLEDSAEDAFLTDTPINIMKSGKFNQVPYITGVTSEEGKAFVYALNDSTVLEEFDKNFEDFVPWDLGLIKGSPESLAVAKQMKKLYFGNESISQDTIPQLTAFVSDYLIVIGVHRAAKFLSAVGTEPVYGYVFSYVGRLNPSGAAHGAESAYLSKSYLLNITVPDDSEEMITVHRMTKMWTDFAKSGNPVKTIDIKWQPLSDDSQTYLHIDAELTIEEASNFEAENLNLWDSIYKDIDEITNNK